MTLASDGAAARRRLRNDVLSTLLAVGPAGLRTRHSAELAATAVDRVEAMEGFAVLSAAQRAGVPAVEVRAVSNEIDEPDRARWRFDDALAALDDALPRLLAELAR